jgi:hypothetical protein
MMMARDISLTTKREEEYWTLEFFSSFNLLCENLTNLLGGTLSLRGATEKKTARSVKRIILLGCHII